MYSVKIAVVGLTAKKGNGS